MIKSFSIKNYRSFGEETTIDFTQSNRKKNLLPNYLEAGRHSISATTVIYGANASGKSNLLRAFYALRWLVLNSASFKVNTSMFFYDPFKLQTDYDKNPVEFGIEFFAAGIRYKYSFSYTKQRVENERLSYFPGGSREALLFERKADSPIIFGENFKGERKTIERMTMPNQLFLSKAAENNSESCIPPFVFFSERLNVPTFPPSLDYKADMSIIKKLAEEPDSAFAKKLNALITSLDTGISFIQATKEKLGKIISTSNKPIPEELKQWFLDNLQYKIKAAHRYLVDENNAKTEKIVFFDIDNESSGTISLLNQGGLIIEALEKGQVLILDEFEKNLHPIITSYLLKLFHHPDLNPYHAQLIFATHDITLLNEDNFNRDQIWFTQKNEAGCTTLIRCSDIKGLRMNVPLDKWYLSGRLGGTAIINDNDFILSMLNDEKS